MTGEDKDDTLAAWEAVADARRDAAMAQARLAEAAVRYADARVVGDTAAGVGSGRRCRAKPGEFVADELALLLRDQPYTIRCLVARARRLVNALPTVWEAFRRGELDAEQIRVIDRVARRVTEPATLAAIDDQVVDAAQARSPKQLQVWLLRLVVQLEPFAFAQRYRRALAERRVTVLQGADGIGYVTGEVSATDAAAIDAMLAATARSLGAEDPRTDQQRRADLFADLLLGRIAFDQPEEQQGQDGGGEDVSQEDGGPAETLNTDWLEVEDIHPDTGELLGTHLQPLDTDGQPIGEPANASSTAKPSVTPRVITRPRTTRIGVVIPLASLLDGTQLPGELADRSGFIPGDILKEQITGALGTNGRDQVLFTRLLTDNGGRLLDVTELGRHPSTRLAKPSKSGPAAADSPPAPCPPTAATLITTNRCRPAKPQVEILTRSAANTTAAKPSHGTPHTETTTASTGPCQTPNATDASTNHYPPGEPRKDQLLPRAIDPRTCAARS